MFKNERETTTVAHETETVIAPSVRVEGDFVSEGNVRIEGEVKGSISTERDLIVGENAKITAGVQARNAVIAGELHGNLRVFDRLELASTARIYGDIQSKVLSVAPGAMMKGQLVIGLEVPVQEKAEPAAKNAEERPPVARGSKSVREQKIEELLQQ
ncbi:MAG TPA: polymer-forming cytoskeletal protein [Candidatus Baltobacteraceae bacterium]|jgi:cytoskeletal protein CcmA (bactofilin family)|nr:polymer-forming cytoskeletal protein [Candidatus Baltobacteraceae bacterium]